MGERAAVNATALTDFLMAAAGGTFALLLARAPGARPTWTWAFLCVTAAAAVGGVYHAGVHTAALWNLIVMLIGVAIALFVVAAARGGLPHGVARTHWIIAGAVITAVGLGFQRSPVASHNVIYHLVQIAGLYAFYRGAHG